MSEWSALINKSDAHRLWFVTKDGLVEMRMVGTFWNDACDAARSIGARYWIEKGVAPVHHFPQEWQVWDRHAWRDLINNPSAPPRPIKKIYAKDISAAHMWVVHQEGREHGQV